MSAKRGFTVVVSDTDPDPDYWIKELDLFDLVLQCPRDGNNLSENGQIQNGKLHKYI